MITEVNTNINNLKNGIRLTFDLPNTLSKQQEYIFYFDCPTTVPDNIIKKINFAPNAYNVSGSNNTPAIVIVNATLTHQIHSKILIRFIIKNTANIIVHTDYKLIKCVPNNTTFSINGKILVNKGGNYGPNGGRILALSETNQLAPSLVTEGDILTGGDVDTTIPTNIKVAVGKNLDPFTFELNVAPIGGTVESSINNPALSGYEYIGPFTVSKSECVGINLHPYPEYTILDYLNNWTYKLNNKILAQFIPDNISDSYDTIIMLPLKDFSSLSDNNPQNIPLVSFITLQGTVGQLSTRVTDL